MAKKQKDKTKPTSVFSPKDFLKGRRPERFSDSTEIREPLLDRSQLEYHLSSITNRSQEVDFAVFAKHLAEREVCPNLIPQTGPTGGGDSKVDSETYPVADNLALGWFSGIGQEAASERWGFAFSAIRKWRPKVIADVQKAIETNRDYRKIFFVSNQYIRDKERGEVEDQLSKQYAVDVRIFDRNWILDKVFTGNNEKLAIDDLKIAASVRTDVRDGPRDAQRKLEIVEVEKRIKEALHRNGPGIQLTEDCLDAADLARQLERPRTEIDGLYLRSDRVAGKHGTNHQRIRSAYEWAWTTYWWFEDCERFYELYATVEDRVKGTTSAYHLELLSNLWTLLRTAVATGQLKIDDSALFAKTAILTAELKRLSSQDDLPSTSLHARALELHVELVGHIIDRQPLDSILEDFQAVINNCKGIIGFPLQPLIEILTEAGEFLGGLPAYNAVFETIVAVNGTRDGEISAARMLLRRGEQEIKANRPYRAIRALGLSFARLYKHESRNEIVRALYLCSYAFERVGLFWAARGTLLAAASIAMNEWWNSGEVTGAQATCVRRLKWLELRLGRIPHALSWYEVETAIRRAATDNSNQNGENSEEKIAFDACLGLLLLKADEWNLKLLSSMPQVFDRMGLFCARAALMYALGYEREVHDDFFHKRESISGMRDFFLKWRDQPTSKELPTEPLLYEEQIVAMKSRVLGCDILVKTDNKSPCLELAESLLAAIESLLSTMAITQVASREPTLTISVRRSELAQEPFEFELQEGSGRPHLEILCPVFEPHALARKSQEELREHLLNVVATIYSRIVTGHDVLNEFKKLVKEERALDRSLNFTGSFVTLGNILGNAPKNRLSLWVGRDKRNYPALRLKPWDADAVPAAISPVKKNKPITTGAGEPPRELLDNNEVNQNQIRTVSLIRESLWDKAKWTGAAYIVTPDDLAPPIIALIFRDAEAAKQIFHHWNQELGKTDAGECLRITILRGIDKNNPFWYRIVVGSEPESELRKSGIKYAVFINRMQTMTPNPGANLEMFLASYGRTGSYSLAPAAITDELLTASSEPHPIDAPYLMKRTLHVRNAWEIGRNDLDSVGIFVDDVPVVPGNQPNPPVQRLLKWKKSKANQ